MPQLKGTEHWNYKHGKCIPKTKCIDCNKKINNCGNGRCEKCASIHRNKIYGNPMQGVRRFGKANPNYKDGRSELQSMIRGLNEYAIWRTEVFRRDNYICQECGSNTGSKQVHHHVKSFVQILEDFLQKYNQFSPIEDKETLLRLSLSYNDFWKLDYGKTLCDKCHIKTFKGV